MVSFVDHNVGRLMKALDTHGLDGNTRVVYTSDHGDNLGTRGLWGKSDMYEEAAGIPMIMAGPEVPRGLVCTQPVSLVDGFPTIVDCVGLPRDPGMRICPAPICWMSSQASRRRAPCSANITPPVRSPARS